MIDFYYKDKDEQIIYLLKQILDELSSIEDKLMSIDINTSSY